MNLTKNIKKGIAEVFFKSQLLPEHKPSGNSVVISNGSVVLFFNCYSIDEFERIQLFLKNNKSIKIDASLIYANFEDAENQDVGLDCKLITQSDFNVFGGIKQNLKNYFVSNKIEVFISFANKHDLFCDKIISRVSSNFKAGKFNKANVKLFDLTINHKIEDYNMRLDHFVQYLNNLKINI